MAKCKSDQWFVILTKTGNIAYDACGLALMSKSKTELEDAYSNTPEEIEGKDIVKIQIPKIVEI